MGNSGKNSNSSQWFLTFTKAPQCDGKHVVFGELISGMDVLTACEKVGTSEGSPMVTISVTDCGVYQPFLTPGSSYWYDTPDPESYSGIEPVFMVRPRVVLVSPTANVSSKFRASLDDKCSLVMTILANDTEKGQIQQLIDDLLVRSATDLVLVAPACKDSVDGIKLPDSWIKGGFQLEEVILAAKPVEAHSIVVTASWLRAQKQWRLDGT